MALTRSLGLNDTLARVIGGGVGLTVAAPYMYAQGVPVVRYELFVAVTSVLFFAILSLSAGTSDRVQNLIAGGCAMAALAAALYYWQRGSRKQAKSF